MVIFGRPSGVAGVELMAVVRLDFKTGNLYVTKRRHHNITSPRSR